MATSHIVSPSPIGDIVGTRNSVFGMLLYAPVPPAWEGKPQYAALRTALATLFQREGWDTADATLPPDLIRKSILHVYLYRDGHAVVEHPSVTLSEHVWHHNYIGQDAMIIIRALLQDLAEQGVAAS